MSADGGLRYVRVMEPVDLVARLSVLEATCAERFRAQEAALRVALDANEKRLDSMNEFRSAIAEQAATMMTRTESSTAYRLMDEKTDGALNAIRTNLETYNRPNYVLAATTISALFGIVAGLWVVIGLKIDTSIAPLGIVVETLKNTQVAQEHRNTDFAAVQRSVQSEIAVGHAGLAQSLAERTQINEKLHDQQAALTQGRAERTAEAARVEAALARLEVWLAFIHTEVFPKTPRPGVKQP